MADTIPDTPLTDGIYIDVYDATSIVVGTEILVQNKSNKIVFLHEVAAKPSDNNISGFILEPRKFAIVTNGANGVWAKGSGPINVQNIS